MAKSRPTYDVFVSHSQRDAKFAHEIAHILRSYDLRVFTDLEMEPAEHVEEALWEALAESQAMVAVVPESESSSWIGIELGAAMAWNKPIYAVASNPVSARVPPGLRGTEIYSASRIEEIAREIKRSSAPLSDSERDVLVDVYYRTAAPLDQLLLRPEDLSKLTKQFTKRARRQVSSEELARMLLRLRKQGALRPSGVRRRPKLS